MAEAIVTAGKRSPSFGKANLAPLDNPQQTGIVSRTVIADQQALRLGDVIRNVSGVALTQQRGGVAETFSARGYSIGVAGNISGIYKDGILVNTAGFPEAGTLESIEVMKGSTALLYGNSSAGLLINMVTRKPRFDWGGEVSANAGSFGLFKPVVDLYGPISKDLAFRVVGSYETSNSYRDVVHTNRKYINPSLLYKIGKKTTVRLQGDFLDANFTPDAGIGILNLNMDAVIPDSRSRYINTNWAYYHSKTSGGSVIVNHQFADNWNLNFIAGGQIVNIDSYGAGLPNNIDGSGNWARALSRTRTWEANSTVQADLTGKFATGKISHQVLIGASYFTDKTRSDVFRLTSSNGKIGTAYDTINILNMGSRVQRMDIPNALDTGKTVAPIMNTGYYVQDLITITPHLKLLAGIRWSYLRTKAPATTNYTKNSVTYGVSAYNNAFSPKGAIIYEPTENMSLYVGFANSFTVNTGTDIYNNPLKPSFINDYEFGWKNYFFDKKVAANFSVYRIRNSNLAQMAVTLADGTPNTNTAIKELTGQTTSDGFDVDISGSLSKNVYFIAGYGLNNARYTHSPGGKGTAVEGEKLNNNPQSTINSTVFYTFTEGVLHGLKLGASAFYTGKRWGGNQNTVGQTPAYNRQIQLPGFWTADLSAGYTYRKLSLQVKLSNITNTLAYLGHDRYSINPIAPRALIATAAFHF
ncbi:TonB-dependent siderophore receptor [Puia sp. P3]|uniref:TonB-dependent siderophore receptor n=1 Tax=Puia sp. P3 TaxID=3423952 RepID=UPI003D678A27